MDKPTGDITNNLGNSVATAPESDDLHQSAYDYEEDIHADAYQTGGEEDEDYEDIINMMVKGEALSKPRYKNPLNFRR